MHLGYMPVRLQIRVEYNSAPFSVQAEILYWVVAEYAHKTLLRARLFITNFHVSFSNISHKVSMNLLPLPKYVSFFEATYCFIENNKTSLIILSESIFRCS
jgi:hypothetical protein